MLSPSSPALAKGRWPRGGHAATCRSDTKTPQRHKPHRNTHRAHTHSAHTASPARTAAPIGFGFGDLEEEEDFLALDDFLFGLLLSGAAGGRSVCSGTKEMTCGWIGQG